MCVLSDRHRAIYWLGNLKSTPIHPELSLNALEFHPPLCVLRPVWNSEAFAPVRVQYPYVDSVHYMIVCIFDVKNQECRPAVVFGRYGAVKFIRHGMDRNTPMKCLRIQDR